MLELTATKPDVAGDDFTETVCHMSSYGDGCENRRNRCFHCLNKYRHTDSKENGHKMSQGTNSLKSCSQSVDTIMTKLSLMN